MEASKVILLDTDIGSDPDDAFALLYLLRRSFPLTAPRNSNGDSNLRLAGITTVSGEANLRASLVSAMLTAEAAVHDHLARTSDAASASASYNYHKHTSQAIKSIPIFAGYSDPLIEKQRQMKCHQAAAVLTDFPHTDFDPAKLPPNRAVDFLAEQILSRPPNTVTLLTIGPMTNIHHLIKSHPTAFTRLDRLVSMAGLFFTRFPPSSMGVFSGLGEWNVFLDPHAAQTVCSTAIKDAFFVGLDVTTQVTMPRTQLESLFAQSLSTRPFDTTMRLLSRLVQPWFEMGTDKVTFHDPLAAVSLFFPPSQLFPSSSKEQGIERGQVEVETQGLAKGMMLLRPPRSKDATKPSHAAAKRVDPRVFFDDYFGTVLGTEADSRMWTKSEDAKM